MISLCAGGKAFENAIFKKKDKSEVWGMKKQRR